MSTLELEGSKKIWLIYSTEVQLLILLISHLTVALPSQSLSDFILATNDYLTHNMEKYVEREEHYMSLNLETVVLLAVSLCPPSNPGIREEINKANSCSLRHAFACRLYECLYVYVNGFTHSLSPLSHWACVSTPEHPPELFSLSLVFYLFFRQIHLANTQTRGPL